MGEAQYYAKAEFRSSEAAEEALPAVQTFVRELQEAYNWWQRHREATWAAFWAGFTGKFPVVTEYLATVGISPANTNGSPHDLSGYMDFGPSPEDDVPFRGTPDEIWFTAEVWHMTDWSHFCNFLKTKFGATKTVWSSETEINPFDALDLTDDS